MPRAFVVLWTCLLLSRLDASSGDLHLSIYQLQHTAWTSKDGAPQQIQYLAQTADGYLWLATAYGLFRFDGVQFEPYHPAGEERGSDSVRSLLATTDNGLWIGFNDGGAAFMKGGRVRRYGERDGLPPGTVYGFAVDAAGAIWAAVNGGLATFAAGRWENAQARGYPWKTAKAVFADRAGTLWAGSATGVASLRRGEQSFQVLDSRLGASYAFAESPGGSLWTAHPPLSVGSLASEGGGSRFDLSPICGDAGSELLFDREGSLWVECVDGVLRIAHPERLTGRVMPDTPGIEPFTARDGFPIRMSTAMLEDREGNIWIGARDGLHRFRATNIVPIVPERHYAAPITLLRAGEDVMAWAVAPSGWNLLRLSGLAADIRDTGHRVTAATQDRNGNPWWGGADGIWHGPSERPIAVPLPSEAAKGADVQALAVDSAGHLWASIVRSGIFRFDTGAWSHFGDLPDLPRDTATSLMADSKGRIWVGYMGNRIALVDGNVVTSFSARDGLDVGSVLAVYEHSGRIWIGGEQGLTAYVAGTFHHMPFSDGLPLKAVTGIVETENGDLWLNAAPGIVRTSKAAIERTLLNPSSQLHGELFDAIDGLPDKTVPLRPVPTAVEGPDGRLWFATAGGIVQIDPNHLLRNAIPPPVFIRRIDAGSDSYAPQERLILPPRISNVHFEYTATSLGAPERVRFRYCLEGVDDRWREAGTRREAFYNNLHPGRYRFRVVASNNDGVWNQDGASLEFSIAPAWFQTTWFHLFAALTATLMAWTVYRLRVRQVRRALSARFDERLVERTRIAQDLHDTFLQTLQGSKLVADDALAPSSDPQQMRRALERLSVWIEQAMHEGRAALNSLRAPIDQANDLADDLRSITDSSTRPGSSPLTVSVSGEPRELHAIVRAEIGAIASEAIRNALRHANASQVTVSIEYGRELLVRVVDNGIGILPEIAGAGRDHHFGLKGMRERATHIGAKFTIGSPVDGGTDVVLTVPGSVVYKERRAGRGRLLSRLLRSVRNFVR